MRNTRSWSANYMKVGRLHVSVIMRDHLEICLGQPLYFMSKQMKEEPNNVKVIDAKIIAVLAEVSD